MTIIIKCAWCEKVLGTKEGGEGVSHGTCPSCKEKQLKELEEMVKEQQEAKGVK